MYPIVYLTKKRSYYIKITLVGFFYTIQSEDVLSALNFSNCLINHLLFAEIELNFEN